MSENEDLKTKVMQRLFNLPHSDLTNEEIKWIATYLPDNTREKGTQQLPNNSTFSLEDFNFDDPEGPLDVIKMEESEVVDLFKGMNEFMNSQDTTSAKNLYISGIKEVFFGKDSKILIKSLVGDAIMRCIKEAKINSNDNPLSELKNLLDKLRRNLPPSHDEDDD